jgi:hypothetical protein
MTTISLPAPSNFYVQQGNGQVLLSWSQVTGATDYEIRKTIDNITFTIINPGNVTQYLDTSVSIGIKYIYDIAGIISGTTGVRTAQQAAIPTKSGQMSLAQIRLLAQQKADRENSNFVTLPEWNAYINQSAFELYDLLTTTFEDYYVASPYIFTSDGSTQLYDLPSDFYKLMGVDCGLALGNNGWITLKKFNFIQRNRYIFPQISSTFLGVYNLQYRLVGNKIEFIPTPSSGQYLRVWYIPRMTQLLADTDILDGVSGWTEYVVVDAAIKALQKEESDTSVLMAQKMALLKRIEETAMNRDVGQPDTISNVRTWGERWGAYGGPGFDGSFGGY